MKSRRNVVLVNFGKTVFKIIYRYDCIVKEISRTKNFVREAMKEVIIISRSNIGLRKFIKTNNAVNKS